MKIERLQDLLSKGLISQDQYDRVEAVLSKKVFSVFYDLRTILYLGILLFSTGIGILIYKNIGQWGHYASLFGLSASTIGCFVFAFKKAPPYSNDSVKPPTPYFDYVVLLGCLLFISVLGYLQFLFGFLNEALGESTLVTAVIFLFAAYRFDHVGVLSLAITALASFWGIQVSPQQWDGAGLFSNNSLHITALIFGSALSAIAIFLDRKKIKPAFTFTYINFSSLIFFVGGLAGLFDHGKTFVYALLLYGGCAFAIYYANRSKSFLFLLYAFVFGYIVTTYLLSDVLLKAPELWFFYMIASCAGFVYFIIRYKNYFKRHE